MYKLLLVIEGASLAGEAKPFLASNLSNCSTRREIAFEDATYSTDS